MDIHKEIDTRGLNCPLPILKAKKALSDMASGQLLKVVATDGGSLRGVVPVGPAAGGAAQALLVATVFGQGDGLQRGAAVGAVANFVVHELLLF